MLAHLLSPDFLGKKLKSSIALVEKASVLEYTLLVILKEQCCTI